MSILVRPVREQLEHDRVIRLLVEKWKRRFLVDANVGDERSAPLKVGQAVHFPDLVFTSMQPPRRVQGIVEVETLESVNDLEASYQWANFGKARAPFFLYIPVSAIDAARRLVAARQVNVAELWSYVTLGEQIHFNLVERHWTPPAGLSSEEVHAAPTPAGRPRPRAVVAEVVEEKGEATASAAGPAPSPAPGSGSGARATKPEGVTKAAGAARVSKATEAKKAAEATKTTKAAEAGRAARATAGAGGRRAAKVATPARAAAAAKARKAAKSTRAPSARASKSVVKKPAARKATTATSARKRPTAMKKPARPSKVRPLAKRAKSVARASKKR